METPPRQSSGKSDPRLGQDRYTLVATGAVGDPAPKVRTKQYYYKKLAFRGFAMVLLLFIIAGTVYAVAALHGPQPVPPTLPGPPPVPPSQRPGRVHTSGRRTPHHQLGIMNGGTADPGQFPWLADIQEIDTGQSRCAGSLIDPNWLVTAAHCVNTVEPDSVRLVIGEHDIAAHDEFEQVRKIKKIIIEPDFSTRNTLPNDIALIQLDEPAEFNDRVAAIGLSREDTNFSACSVAGWGAAGVDPNTGLPVYPTKLQMVNLTMVPLDECRKKMAGYDLTVNMTCAEGSDGGDVCWGDSGGSLTCPPAAAPGPWTLVGVTSWGIACGYIQYPSVYTRVSRFINWIEAETGIAVPPASGR